MDVVKYDKSQWDLVAESIHQTIFKEVRLSSLNRFDYALVIWDENRPIGYITCRETDSESIYISYGGVLPESRNSLDSADGMKALIEYLKKHYKRANMLVENNNVFMLKKALNSGFLPVGVTNYCNSIFVDLRLEW